DAYVPQPIGALLQRGDTEPAPDNAPAEQVGPVLVGTLGIGVSVFTGLIDGKELSDDRLVPLHVRVADDGGRNVMVVVAILRHDNLAGGDPFGRVPETCGSC